MDRAATSFVVVVMALGAAWGFARGGGGEPVAPAAPVRTGVITDARPAGADRRTAREAFAHSCGACHALRDAGAHGVAGPDLDERRPDAERVRRMIRTGSLDGVMQPNLLTGRDARRVARYVARVAGS